MCDTVNRGLVQPRVVVVDANPYGRRLCLGTGPWAIHVDCRLHLVPLLSELIAFAMPDGVHDACQKGQPFADQGVGLPKRRSIPGGPDMRCHGRLQEMYGWAFRGLDRFGIEARADRMHAASMTQAANPRFRHRPAPLPALRRTITRAGADNRPGCRRGHSRPSGHAYRPRSATAPPSGTAPTVARGLRVRLTPVRFASGREIARANSASKLKE